MQIDMVGKNFDVSSELREFTHDKLVKRLEAYAEKITTLHVTFNVEKLQQIAEATLHLSGMDIHARSEAADMYAAVDGLIDKLFRQVIKQKEKLSSHHRGESRDE